MGRSNALDGKTVVITGGAGGIGQAAAAKFMAAGAKVALVDLDESNLLLAAERLLQNDQRPLTVPCDITDFDQCNAAADQIRACSGGIDILINNAGLTQIGLFENNDIDVYRRTMDVNFFGSVHMTKVCLPDIIERQGHIAAISSVTGFAPLLGRTGYCASKHALNGFFDTLRAELRPKGVGVSILCPTFVQTGFSDKGLGADGKQVKSTRSETGQSITADDVANEIVDAVTRNIPRKIIGNTGKLAWWVSRLAPNYYERQMAKRFAAEFERD